MVSGTWATGHLIQQQLKWYTEKKQKQIPMSSLSMLQTCPWVHQAHGCPIWSWDCCRWGGNLRRQNVHAQFGDDAGVMPHCLLARQPILRAGGVWKVLQGSPKEKPGGPIGWSGPFQSCWRVGLYRRPQELGFHPKWSRYGWRFPRRQEEAPTYWSYLVYGFSVLPEACKSCRPCHVLGQGGSWGRS